MKLKNKKGFTLVELLAVIVILAVIALIAVPIVSSMIKDSKRKTFETSANGLVESAKVYYSGRTEEMDFEGKTFKFGKDIDIKGLNIKGKNPTDGEIIVNVDGEVKMYVTDGEYCAFKDFESNVITISEGTECSDHPETPVINLAYNMVTTNRISLIAECRYESGNKIEIEKYEFSKDGGKTWNSRIENNKYLNFYTYDNLEQNTKYNLMARCVTKVGTSAQKGISVETSKIEKMMIDVPDGWAMEKEVTVSYPKGRYTYQYQELDSINDTISEDKWKTIDDENSEWEKVNNHKNSSTHNVFSKVYKENKYIIIRVIDSAGNYVDSASTAIQKIDRTPPVCGNWTGNSTWTNKSVTVKVACNETQDEANNISGCTASTYNVKTYSTTTKIVTLSYTIKDNAGNTTECSDTVDVYVDTNKPKCANSGGNTNWTNGSIVLTGTCSDTGGSGCKGNVSTTYSSNTNTTTASPGIVYDNAGNSVTCPSDQTVKIDKTAPKCANSGGNTNWTNVNIVLTGTCSDTGGSGCKGNASKTYSSNTNTTTASPGTVYDNAGNSITCPSDQTVKIDKTAPTCTSSGGSASWTNGNRTITGTCSDTGGSGCTGNASKTYSSSTSTTTASPGTVYDNAGNSTPCPSDQTVKVDKDAPSVPSINNSSGGSWSRGNVSITVSSTDTGSGVKSIAYNYDNDSTWRYDWDNDGAYTNITNGKKATGTWSVERNNKTFFRACDNVGNCSGTSETYVRIDKTAPTLSNVSNSSGGSWTKSNVTISYTSSDNLSGVNRVVYSYDQSTELTDISTTGGTWSVDRNNTVYLKIYDNAGNSSGWTSAGAVKIDKTGPTMDFGPASGTYASGNIVSVGCSDSGSGMNLTKLEDAGYWSYYDYDAYAYGTSTRNYTAQKLASLRTNKVSTAVCIDNLGNTTTQTRTYTITGSGSSCSSYWTYVQGCYNDGGTCIEGTTSGGNCYCRKC